MRLMAVKEDFMIYWYIDDYTNEVPATALSWTNVVCIISAPKLMHSAALTNTVTTLLPAPAQR